EMYAAVLENAGITVELKINLGGTLIAHQALVAGEIDLYPEYTGTSLASVVKGEMSTDAARIQPGEVELLGVEILDLRVDLLGIGR
ncbi:glycine betaine ABC transporter substrate-binding protein, partial [Rhizobium ruizarguesonis]